MADLAAQFAAPLHRYFRKRGFSVDVSDDYKQDVLLRMLKLQDRSRIDNPEAYVFRVAGAVIADRARRDGVRSAKLHDCTDDVILADEEPCAERVLVALDKVGGLATATSTGGIYGKSPGRVGDTPIIGAGTWADSRVAVSCTGLGEAFIRASAAHDLAARVRYAGQGLDQAAAGVLVDVAHLGGDGGLIAIDADGQITMPFDTDGMKRAWATHSQLPQVAVFK